MSIFDTIGTKAIAIIMVAAALIAEVCFLAVMKTNSSGLGLIASSVAAALFLFPLWRVVWLVVSISAAGETFKTDYD